jgi:2-polyprenyl-6-methoxyphenol hydroxylase-like FAD-dependent oxidoreductase
MGRSAHTPAFLETWGYQRPIDQKYAVNLSYSSQFFRVPAGALTEKVAAVNRPLEKFAGAGLLAYEDGTVILTLSGLAGHKPPPDLPGVLDAATELLPSQIGAALRTAEPFGEVSAQYYPASVWRRYDKLDQFPQGFLVIGDAVCSFNPVWGKGMTSAALQAAALHECISDVDDGEFSRRYFRAAAKKLAPIWWTNRFIDFTVMPADDWRSKPKQQLNWCTNKVWAAAATDIVLTETFVRTLELLDRPTILLQPTLLKRIIAGNRRTTAFAATF